MNKYRTKISFEGYLEHEADDGIPLENLREHAAWFVDSELKKLQSITVVSRGIGLPYVASEKTPPVMEEGRRYRILYRLMGQRFDRQAVLDFLGEDKYSYLFNARPVAGTQSMTKGHVLSWQEVPKTTPIEIGKRA